MVSVAGYHNFPDIQIVYLTWCEPVIPNLWWIFSPKIHHKSTKQSYYPSLFSAFNLSRLIYLPWWNPVATWTGAQVCWTTVATQNWYWELLINRTTNCNWPFSQFLVQLIYLSGSFSARYHNITTLVFSEQEAAIYVISIPLFNFKTLSRKLTKTE